jgi:hypothetical protein
MSKLVQFGANDFNLALLTAEHYDQKEAAQWLNEGAAPDEATKAPSGYADPGYSSMLGKFRKHELKQEQLRQRKAAQKALREEKVKLKEQELKLADIQKHQQLMNEGNLQKREQHRAQISKQQHKNYKTFLLGSTAKHINIVRQNDLDQQEREKNQRAQKAVVAHNCAATTTTLSSLQAVLAKNKALKPVKSTGDLWTVSIARNENTEYCAAPESYYVAKYHTRHREQILKTRTVVDHTDGLLRDRSHRAFTIAQEYADKRNSK